MTRNGYPFRPKANYLGWGLADCGASLESHLYHFSGASWRMLSRGKKNNRGFQDKQVGTRVVKRTNVLLTNQRGNPGKAG